MPKTAKLLKLNLNLLYPQGIPLKLPTKIFKWLLSFGRYIGIIVEILVLVTFAARFKLDADLADVNEKINRQIPFIENKKADEQKIKQTQFKLTEIKKALASVPNWQEILKKMSDEAPKGTVFTNLSFDHSKTSPELQFKITGTASSNNDLAILLSGLKKQPAFKDINLGSLGLDETGLTFTITGGIK